MSEVLTITDVIDLTVIILAAQANAPIVRFIDGRRFEGIARYFCDERGKRAPGTDIRNLFLRVTLTGGTDVYWLVRELMADVAEGAFVDRDGS